MPAVVGASGIEYQVPIKINETETEQLKACLLYTSRCV